jgi:hypothetical protein
MVNPQLLFKQRTINGLYPVVRAFALGLCSSRVFIFGRLHDCLALLIRYMHVGSKITFLKTNYMYIIYNEESI